MAGSGGRPVHNGETFPRAELPVLGFEAFRRQVLAWVADGGRVASYFVRPGRGATWELTAVVAFDAEGLLHVLATQVSEEFPSLTPECPQVHYFEREIWEQQGVRPVGHPWLKPVRFQSTAVGDADPAPTPPTAVLCGVTDFFQVDGEEVHEVAVGPVHAGVIEPGHFRFQCHGETVLHLEISLGYQHRGVERALRGGPHARTIHHIETLAGDSTVAHAIAYCWAVESLSGARVPPRAQAIRGIALELERIANHLGDLGALAGDVGYLPTAAYCGRIRGDVLNATALLCGNRFGRNLVRPGGVAFDLDAATAALLRERLQGIGRDARVAVELLWDSPSVMARLERMGALSADWATQIGLVGLAARATGLRRDVRHDFPAGIFRFAQIPVSTWDTGDVFARAYLRWLEAQRSLNFIDAQLEALPRGEVRRPLEACRPEAVTVTLAEGWRGEVCHFLATDVQGRLETYKIVDPSFHNWFGLALAMRNQPISDFPLCNKSFNLSYCGHDL